jgi:hypothetical protein
LLPFPIEGYVTLQPFATPGLQSNPVPASRYSGEFCRQELYNLKRDIGESENLAKRMPEKAAEMRAQLDAMLKEHGAKIPAPDPGYKKK